MSQETGQSDPPDNNNIKTDIQSRIKRSLLPLSLFSAVAAAIIEANKDIVAVESAYTQKPVIVGALIAISIILIGFMMVRTFNKERARISVVLIHVTLVVLIAAVYFAAIVYPRRCDLTNWCKASPYNPYLHLNFLVGPAYAANTPPLEILDVAIDQERSTFILSRDDMSIHAERENRTRISIDFDREMPTVFSSASCRGIGGEAPIEDALPVWQTILKDRGRADLAQKISDYAGYRNLIQHGGDHGFFDARPTVAELITLNKSKPELYSIILHWLVECVGVAEPVLIWTLKNNTNKDMTVSAVDYNVIDIGQVMGGGPDTIEPIDVQPHVLVHATGTQRQNVFPRVILHPGNIAEIRIYYQLENSAPGYTWLVQPTFRTLEGVSAQGPELKIFAAKYSH